MYSLISIESYQYILARVKLIKIRASQPIRVAKQT